MTFQTFNHRVLAIFLLMIASVSIHAQQPTQADMLNNVAKLKRIEAMQPDSIQPKYQLALQSLSFSVTYPHAPQTENMIAEAEQTITKMEQMKMQTSQTSVPFVVSSIWYASCRIPIKTDSVSTST